MAKGSYNISVPGDSNFERGRGNNNEDESEDQECMNSCLNSVFLRSLSFHDRPRSSRVPTDKKFRCIRYKALASSSIEKIPSNLLLPSERKLESSTYHCSESVAADAEAEVTTQSPIYNASPSAEYQQTDQNQLSGAGNWLEDRYTRLGIESEKLLKKTIAILRAVDKDISVSFTNLTKPESIALESVTEIYRNKGKSTANCSVVSELDLSMETSSQAGNENRQPSVQQRPKDAQIYSTSRRPNDLQSVSPRQSPKNLQIQSPRKSPKNMQVQSPQQTSKNLMAQYSGQSSKETHYFQQSPKSLQSHSYQQSSKNLQSVSPRQSPKNLQIQSSRQTSKKNLMAHCSGQSSKETHYFQQSPKGLQSHSAQQSPKGLQSHSAQQSPKGLQSHSAQQSPKHLQNIATPYSPKHLLVHSAQQTLTNLQSQLSSNSGNTQSLTKPDSDNPQSTEQSPRNVLPSPKRIARDDNTKVKFPIEFDLPSDHEQFVKIIGALQNRCLEYREMIQDIAVSALEECLNFSEFSVGQIRHLRKQFGSQKRNFRDFKELCCKSVVFGPDSQPIDEKVTEVIQSFYLKLLQEENETFMARLEFGLKMGEVYAKMLNYETESRKIITTLEKEILYLKKTSIGFKV